MSDRISPTKPLTGKHLQCTLATEQPKFDSALMEAKGFQASLDLPVMFSSDGNQARQAVQCWQFVAGQWETTSIPIIVEKPVSLIVNGEPWLTLLCTPVDLEALAVGFLFNEGLIEQVEEITSVRAGPDTDNVEVWLRRHVVKPKHWGHSVNHGRSVTSIVPDTARPATQENVTLLPQQVCDLFCQLLEAEDLYRKVRGVHTSALSDGQRLFMVTEDIGRHNTFDKISGRCLLEGLHLAHRILLTTGRVNSQMLYKAIRLGATVVISRSSSSSLSTRLAEQAALTLIGYARRDCFTVYTHPQRIITTL